MVGGVDHEGGPIPRPHPNHTRCRGADVQCYPTTQLMDQNVEWFVQQPPTEAAICGRPADWCSRRRGAVRRLALLVLPTAAAAGGPGNRSCPLWRCGSFGERSRRAWRCPSRRRCWASSQVAFIVSARAFCVCSWLAMPRPSDRPRFVEAWRAGSGWALRSALGSRRLRTWRGWRECGACMGPGWATRAAQRFFCSGCDRPRASTMTAASVRSGESSGECQRVLIDVEGSGCDPAFRSARARVGTESRWRRVAGLGRSQVRTALASAVRAAARCGQLSGPRGPAWEDDRGVSSGVIDRGRASPIAGPLAVAGHLELRTVAGAAMAIGRLALRTCRPK